MCHFLPCATAVQFYGHNSHGNRARFSSCITNIQTLFEIHFLSMYLIGIFLSLLWGGEIFARNRLARVTSPPIWPNFLFVSVFKMWRAYRVWNLIIIIIGYHGKKRALNYLLSLMNWFFPSLWTTFKKW